MEESKFKPFDKVLVRNKDTAKWRATFFSHYIYGDIPGNIIGYACNSTYYNYCVPFEGNEHLVGTSKSPEPPMGNYNWGDKVEVQTGNGDWEQAIYKEKTKDVHLVYYGNVIAGFSDLRIRPIWEGCKP